MLRTLSNRDIYYAYFRACAGVSKCVRARDLRRVAIRTGEFGHVITYNSYVCERVGRTRKRGNCVCAQTSEPRDLRQATRENEDRRFDTRSNYPAGIDSQTCLSSKATLCSCRINTQRPGWLPNYHCRETLTLSLLPRSPRELLRCRHGPLLTSS